MPAWVTPASIGSTWPDAARLPALDVAALLEAAQEGVEAYMPAERVPAPGDPIPARIRLAVILHARDLHAATQRGNDLEVAGDAGLAFRVRPLSDAVKALVRPSHGRPRFGAPASTSSTPVGPILDGGAP